MHLFIYLFIHKNVFVIIHNIIKAEWAKCYGAFHLYSEVRNSEFPIGTFKWERKIPFIFAHGR